MADSPPAPSWLEIDLNAIVHNTMVVKQKINTALMAVVKANAYGFGAVEVAQAVLSAGAAWLAVARFCEAHDLRQAGIQAPILIFGSLTQDEVDEAIQNDVSLTLHSPESLKLYKERASVLNSIARVHMKVDTGFGRFGVLPEDALNLAQTAIRSGVIELEGLYSHLSMADEQPDHPATNEQIYRFECLIILIPDEF